MSFPDARMPALTFNVLLQAAGLDPAAVRLVRHRDPRHEREVYDAALAEDPSFERYQETQGNPKVIQQFRATWPHSWPIQ